MRKQDRIANQQQDRPAVDPSKKDPAQRSSAQERIKSSATEPPRPQRQPGKLPLPD